MVVTLTVLKPGLLPWDPQKKIEFKKFKNIFREVLCV